MRECRTCHRNKPLTDYVENKGAYGRICLDCLPFAIKQRQRNIEKTRAATRSAKMPGLVRLINWIKRSF